MIKLEEENTFTVFTKTVKDDMINTTYGDVFYEILMLWDGGVQVLCLISLKQQSKMWKMLKQTTPSFSSTVLL